MELYKQGYLGFIMVLIISSSTWYARNHIPVVFQTMIIFGMWALTIVSGYVILYGHDVEKQRGNSFI